jgi:hypothetical protein
MTEDRDGLQAAVAALNMSQRSALIRFGRRITGMTDAAVGRDQHFSWMREGTGRPCLMCNRPGESHSTEEIGRCMKQWTAHVLTNPAPSANPATADRATAADELRKVKMWADIHRAESAAKRRAAAKKSGGFNPYVVDVPPKPDVPRLGIYDVSTKGDKHADK